VRSIICYGLPTTLLRTLPALWRELKSEVQYRFSLLPISNKCAINAVLNAKSIPWNAASPERLNPQSQRVSPAEHFVPASLPPEPALVIDASLQERLDEAHLALGRLDSITVLLPETSVFLYSYVRKEAVMSSQIEGTQSSLSDLLLFEAEGSPGVPLDDVREVSCYVGALEHGLALLKGGLPLCTRLMNEMHAKLMTHGRGAGKAPGEVRRTQNWIGGASPARAAFVPPPPQRVDACLSGLEKFLNDQPVRHSALIKAALSHVQFETIHPYLDGNGRLGRLLIPLILVHERVLREPLLYLSLYFKAYRSNYYEMLQRVRARTGTGRNGCGSSQPRCASPLLRRSTQRRHSMLWARWIASAFGLWGVRPRRLCRYIKHSLRAL
jgi:Fic family protein